MSAVTKGYGWNYKDIQDIMWQRRHTGPVVKHINLYIVALAALSVGVAFSQGTYVSLVKKVKVTACEIETYIQIGRAAENTDTTIKYSSHM